MGGIGKSTIAKFLFAKLFIQYDNVCFVDSSKEYSLDKLFSALLKEEVSTSTVVGSTFDMRRLSNKKVLIVLDGMCNVDNQGRYRLDLLEYLCKEFGDLHHESRLIITTRDKQLLVGKVECIYKVKKLKSPESLELFCLEAFKRKHPHKGYESLSESAVKYADGVPLALKVLGSYLHTKNINFWKCTLEKLSEYPNEKIQNVLKESYTGLDDLEKNIFLDIAFFFKEKKKDHVIRILDACDFAATSGIEVLEDKALITVSNSNIIQMHDLMQKMGLEIVREECKGDPGQRTRLKDKEAREVIEKNKELDNLEGIELRECKQFEEVPDLSKAPRLKWVNLSCCESLQYLHPSVLSSDTLVTLILDGCTNLKRVKGEKHLKSLEKISVKGCSSLEEFALSSDLIENLDLSNTGIQTLDTSIGRMHKLKWLNLEGLRLGHLLKELSCLTSLQELKLSDSGLVIDKQQLHTLFDGLRSLQILHMKDMSNLVELPDNISGLSQLQELRLDGSNVKRLPESIKILEELQILSVENCKELLCLPTLPSRIKYLGATNCISLVSVSNLNTLATKMLGMTKHITFKNNLNLDGPSLKLIMESLHLTMMSAAFDNVLVRIRGAVNGHNYNSVELCLPGSRVPWKIQDRTTKSSISIELPKRSNFLGFIYWVVLSPAGGMKKHGTKIKCICHLPGKGTKATWLCSDIRGLNSDHVYVWYDPFHCDSILKYYEPKVSFEFCVANENDEAEVDGSICIKECGINLIRVSDVLSVLEELDLDSNKKKDLEKGVKWETERYAEEESNGIRNQIANQQWKMSEHSTSDGIVGIFQEGRNWESDDEESLKTSRIRKGRAKSKSLVTSKKSSDYSTVHPETGFEQESTTTANGSEPTQFEAKFASSSGAKGTIKQPKESHKRMKVKVKIPSPLPSAFEKVDMESVSEPAQEKSQPQEEESILNQETEESYSSSSSEEESKDALRVLYKTSSFDFNQQEKWSNSPNRGKAQNSSESFSSKDQLEVGSSKVVSEYTPMEIDDYLNKLNDDPFALFDFLSSNVSLSSKLSETTIQQSRSTEKVSNILEELRSLAFSQSLLCNIQRVEYREQVEVTLKKLDNYIRDLSESQSKGLNKFNDFYNKVVTICKDKSLNEEKAKKIEAEKKKAFDKLKDYKSKVQKLDDVVATNKGKIETVEKRQRMIQETIKKLQQENEGLNKEKTKLQTANSKQLANKQEILESVKYVSTSLSKAMKHHAELDKERSGLNADFENLKELYKKMKRSPPF
ncbi:hypothetical protein AAZX31_07G007000 [Glycine max]